MLSRAVIATTSTGTVILAAGASNQMSSVSLFFCNTTANDETINVHLCDSGQNALEDNAIIYELTIPGKETFKFDMEKIVIQNSESIKAVAVNGGRVRATASYMIL